MKRYSFLSVILFSAILFACKKEDKGVAVPVPHDITFEELEPGELSFVIPDGPFKAGNAGTGMVTLNTKKNPDGSFTGFAMSGKNWRSYPWNLSPDFAPATLTAEQVKAAIDSCIFSVYTTRPNYTGNYVVASVKDDDAAITLDRPAVVEHILVANTTYNYLLETYGSTFSGTLNPTTQAYDMSGTKVRNPNNSNTSTERYGRFTLPGPGGSSLISLAGQETLAKRAAGTAAADAARLAGKSDEQVAADSTAAAEATAKGFVKLTAQGFNAEKSVGEVDFWLAIRTNVDPALPAYNIILGDWYKMDLSALGTVDKIIFRLSSSDTDGAGNMRTPPYFCLDGIRIRQ